MFTRLTLAEIRASLEQFPAVGIIGVRQVGKTTLAKRLSKDLKKDSIYLDLERPSDIVKLEQAEFYFQQNRDKLIILDEVQKMPELFPLLRAEIDDHKEPNRFLLLGSASPDLIRSSSESLAGRIDYHELSTLFIQEVSPDISSEQLWLKGGFPDVVDRSTVQRKRWYDAFVTSYIERDLPAIGLNTTSVDLRRLFSMLAHLQGHPENDSELARSLGVKSPTVKRAIDYIQQALLLRRLPAWHTNQKKRLVKSPKLYLKDTGLLHNLLGIQTMDGLLGHPAFGASFETFVIHHLSSLPELAGLEPYYYRTQDGTEADLVMVENGQVKFTIECKATLSPDMTKSAREVIKDLRPQRFIFITPGDQHYQKEKGVEVLGIANQELASHLRL